VARGGPVRLSGAYGPVLIKMASAQLVNAANATYRRTKNVLAVQILLGHSKLENARHRLRESLMFAAVGTGKRVLQTGSTSEQKGKSRLPSWTRFRIVVRRL
jgi:hypothetical protein